MYNKWWSAYFNDHPNTVKILEWKSNGTLTVLSQPLQNPDLNITEAAWEPLDGKSIQVRYES